jgi:hypothetical protein
MRADVITASQRRMVEALVGRISDRLATEFEKSPNPDSMNVCVTLKERGKSGRMEIPYALLLQAESDLRVHDMLRVRIKAARDRMLFRPPPPRLQTAIQPLGDPASDRRGGFRQGGWRGRR